MKIVFVKQNPVNNGINWINYPNLNWMERLEPIEYHTLVFVFVGDCLRILPWQINMKNHHLGNVFLFFQPPSVNLRFLVYML